MEILKAKDFKIGNRGIYIPGYLYSNGVVSSLNGFNSDELDLANKYMLCSIMSNFVSENPYNGKMITSVYINGTLKINEGKLSVFNGDTLVRNLQEFEIQSIIYILESDKTEIMSKDDFVKDIREYYNERKEELEREFGSRFSDLKADDDLFSEWLEQHYKFKKNHYYGPTEFIMELSQELSEELSDIMECCHGYNYGSYDIYDMWASRSIFYIRCDEFGGNYGRGYHSDVYRFMDKFVSEYSNDKLPDRIPSSGVSKDMAAEIISNANYVLYRYFNDGDLAENIINERNCRVALNIMTYLDHNVSNYESTIFNVFRLRAANKIYDFNRYNCKTLEEYESMTKDTPLPQTYYGNSVPKELEDQILAGTFTKEMADEYPDLYNYAFRCSDCEFMLFEVSFALVAMFDILKVYPDFLKDKNVIDLRGEIIRY